MSEDGEDKFIIVFETIIEVFECHDGIFYFFSEECLLEEVVELYLIELTDDEYIHYIIRGLVTEVENSLRDSHKIKRLATFEEVLNRSHDIICLQEHLTELIVYRAIMIHLVILFLILLV